MNVAMLSDVEQINTMEVNEAVAIHFTCGGTGRKCREK